MSLNKAMLIGFVGRNPDIRTTKSNKKVANMRIATGDHKKGNDKKTEWHNIVAWDKQAEFIEGYVGKGAKVFVEGEIRTREYEKDGVKKQITEIHAYNFQLLSGGKDKPAATEGASVPDLEDEIPF